VFVQGVVVAGLTYVIDCERSEPVCLIALVATGRPLRPGRRVVRIGLVATDGSRYLQSGTICPAICYRYLFGVAN